MIRLTPLEQIILAAASAVDWLPHTSLPAGANGAYRALVLRGLLERDGGRYSLTPEGRLAVESLQDIARRAR